MYRPAALVVAIIPLTGSAQNEITIGELPDFMIERERTPELDIERATCSFCL